MALRGRWSLVRANAFPILAYGLMAVAGCQVAYFYAVQRLTVGVALLLISFLLLPDSPAPAAPRSAAASAPGDIAMVDTPSSPSYTPLAPDAPHPVTPLGLIGALALVGGICVWAVLQALRGRRR